jgi:hypothetical protein
MAAGTSPSQQSPLYIPFEWTPEQLTRLRAWALALSQRQPPHASVPESLAKQGVVLLRLLDRLESEGRRASLVEGSLLGIIGSLVIRGVEPPPSEGAEAGPAEPRHNATTPR